jgi:glucokinase
MSGPTLSRGDDLLIGLDIGGTAVKAVRLRADGTGVERMTVPAGKSRDRVGLLALIRTTVAALANGEHIAQIGCAVGGLVRADGSMPANATNLPQLADIPLEPLFSTALNAPCYVLNDARAAMHGEAWLGAARGIADALLVTLGTGIGSGLLLGGRVREGAHGGAGELGAWSIDAHTLEALAAPANIETRTGRRLGDMILSGAIEAEGRAALDALGRGLAQAHLLLDVDLIVIGGSIAAVGEPLRTAVELAFTRHCPPAHHHGVRIVTSELGAYAGAIGAVAPSVRETRV